MRRAARQLVLAWLAGLALAACGCGSGSKLYEVTGTVTLDGNKLADGDITFYPEDKQFGPTAGKIKDGKYTLKARPGKNRVEIRATRAVPGKTGPMGTEPLLEHLIPKQYNVNTTLSADVGPDKTTFDFPLKSK